MNERRYGGPTPHNCPEHGYYERTSREWASGCPQCDLDETLQALRLHMERRPTDDELMDREWAL